MKRIGTGATLVAYIIKYLSTLQVANIILFMPIVLLIMLQAGEIPKIQTTEAIRMYGFYTMTALGSWIIYLTQKKIIKPLYNNYLYKKNRSEEIY